MKLLDLSHPSFRPVWLRAVVVAACLAWGIFEFSTGAVFWGVLFVGVGCVAAWQFATLDYGDKPDDSSQDH